MKETLIRNLWLMIIAWCLYLNGYTLIAMGTALITGVCVLVKKGEADLKRSGLFALCMYTVILSLYHSGNIPYFFPSLHTFGAMIAFDAAILQELMYKIRRKEMLTILSFMLMAYLLITLLVIFADESDYALFGKSSLFLMNAFIFLPFLIPSVLIYVHRTEQAIARKQQKVTGKIADI